MIPTLKIRVKETRPPDLTRDAWRKACKTAFAAIGEYWFKNFLPKHFGGGASMRYGYRPRGDKYNERKRKKTGKATDLIFTGRMMDAVLRNKAIRSYPTRVTVQMFGPPYMKINFRKSANQPDKKREMTKLTGAELQTLLRLFKTIMLDEVKKFRASRTTKIA